MTVSVPYEFVNGTAADADQVNQNFDALVNYVNTEVPLLTGERSYTGALDFANFKALRVGTPTEPTDGANKQYADSVIPVGVIQMFAGIDAKIPPQWVKCNGQALSRNTYSDLFNAIGTNYGPGDGVNTFNVPNFTGSAAPGTPNADGVLRFPYPAAPGTRGGSHDAVVVSHNHDQNGHNHTQNGHGHGHTLGINGGGHEHSGRAKGFVYWANDYGTGQSTTTPPGPNQPWGLSWQTTTDGGGAHSHGVTGGVSENTASNNPETATNQPTGVSGTGANIPAYLGVNFIIRTGV
jgi:microcystin-dependent protein